MKLISDQDLGISHDFSRGLEERRTLYREITRTYIKHQTNNNTSNHPYIELILEIPPDFDLIRWIIDIWCIMRRLQESREDILISLMRENARSVEQNKIQLVDDLVNCLLRDQPLNGLDVRAQFSPIIDLFLSIFRPYGFIIHRNTPLSPNLINHLIESISRCKLRMREQTFKRKRDDFERSTRANERSLIDYFSSFRDKYKSLIFVRLNLSMEKMTAGAVNYIDLANARRNIKKWIDKRFKGHLVEYVFKLDANSAALSHYHLVLIFDQHAAKIASDAGRLIGECWVAQSELGRRFYYAPDSRKNDCYGWCTGEIDMSSEGFPKQYRSLVAFLTQLDYLIKPKLPPRVRTLFRRTIHN